MDIHSIIKRIVPLFRRKRMKLFTKTFCPIGTTRILDVGGTMLNWELIKCDSKITLLNLTIPQNASSFSPQYTFVVGDGAKMMYSDNQFDIAYSNSTIEHLGSFERQQAFAAELRRVAEKIWVQTPSRWFFVEPHFLTPFIHYLPKGWQRRLVRNFTLWGWITRPTQQYVDNVLSEIRLLSHEEMQRLFPDCVILREKFFGFTKCFIAIRT